MKPVAKFFLYVVLIAIVIAILYYVSRPIFEQPEKPKGDPTYQDAVPANFVAQAPQRVLDARDTSPLLIPTTGVRKVSHAITKIACPDGHPQCRARALYDWVKEYILHRDALTSRSHIIGPEESIVYREGTDVTMTILLISMLRAEGFDAHMVLAPANRAYVNVTIMEEEHILDPGCGGCSFGSNRLDEPSSVAYVR